MNNNGVEMFIEKVQARIKMGEHDTLSTACLCFSDSAVRPPGTA